MSPNGLSILVVDDEIDTCRNLADILEDLGHQVTIATNGEQALQLVRDNAFDVALLDLKMPGMDGLTLYREIRKLRAGTVAIVVTGYASSETVAEARDAGAWQVLSKPVDFARLLPLVDEAGRQPLVLVVDDDHVLCQNLWDILRDKGFRVSFAHDHKQAAAQLRHGKHSVVLIDMKLPGGSGREVHEMVRKGSPQAKTVLITGHRSELEQLIEETIREGADAVCYKPFDIPQLIDTVSALSRVGQ